MLLVDERAHLGANVGPHERSLCGRHQGSDPQRLSAKGTKVRRGKAQADKRLTLQTAPASPNAVRKQPSHHRSERPVIEISQFGNVTIHMIRWLPACPPKPLLMISV